MGAPKFPIKNRAPPSVSSPLPQFSHVLLETLVFHLGLIEPGVGVLDWRYTPTRRSVKRNTAGVNLALHIPSWELLAKSRVTGVANQALRLLRALHAALGVLVAGG